MRAAVFVFLSCLMMVSTTWAQRISKQEVKEAKELFIKGQDFFREEKYVEALDSLQRSFDLVNRASTVLMIAHCYRLLHWPDKAMWYYDKYLSMVEQEGIVVMPRVLQDVKRFQIGLQDILDLYRRGREFFEHEKHEEALAEFKRVQSLTPWSETHLQMALCQSELGRHKEALEQIDLAVSAYNLYISRWRFSNPGDPPGYSEIEGLLKKLQDLRSSVLEAMKPKVGFLRLGGLTAGAEVLLDGTSRSPGSVAAPVELKPGKHRILVKSMGKVWSREVEIVAGEEIRVEVMLRDVRRRRSKLWLIGGVSCLAVAAAYEVMAWGSYSSANRILAEDSRFDDFRNAVIAGHVLAGIFAAASGVGFWLYYRSGQETERRMAGAAVLPSAHGVQVGGSFNF